MSNFPSSISLNGTNQYGKSTSQPTISGSFTVEARFRGGALSANAQEIVSTREPSTDRVFDLSIQSTGVHCDIGDGANWLTTAANATVSFNNSYGYQVAVVVTTTGYKIYADGVLIGSGSFSGTPLLCNSSLPIWIGAYAGTGQWWNGQLEEIRVWNVALTQSVIQSWMDKEADNTHPNWTNLQVCYHCDDGAGSTLVDATGHGYNATLYNSPGWVTPGFNLVPFLNYTVAGWTTTFENMDAVLNGKYYVIGGRSSAGGSPVSINQMYDPSTNTWTSKSATGFTARVKLFGDISGTVIYAIGGGGIGIAYPGSNEAYDTSTNTWTSKLAQPQPCESATANQVGGVIYCAGGSQYNVPSGSYSFTIYNLNQGYDTASNSWTNYSTANFTPVAYAAEGTIDGVLYLFGGYSSSALVPSNIVQAYNVSSNSWQPRNNIGLLATFSSISAVCNGQLYAFGGSSQTGQISGYVPISTVNAYSPSADAWQILDNTGFLPVAAGCAGVANGIVYLIGGATSATVLTNVQQLFIPPNPLPAIPVLISPANGSRSSSLDVGISWNAASLATSYDYEVATDPNFTNVIVSGNTPGTSVALHFSLMTYYWRVKSDNSGGSSNWSTVWSFTVFIFIGVPHCDFYVYPETTYLAQDEREGFRVEPESMIYVPDEREVFQA